MKLLAEERRVSGNGNWPKAEAKKEGGSHFRNMTSQWRNQGGQRGQLTLPKCQEGPAPTWTFCDLLALKLFRRGLESWKLLTMWAHNIKIPERAPTGAMRPLAKRNCCQIGSFNAYLPERVSTVAVKTGPFWREIPAKAGPTRHLPKGAGPYWSCEYEYGPFQKETASKADPQQHPFAGASPN